MQLLVKEAEEEVERIKSIAKEGKELYYKKSGIRVSKDVFQDEEGNFLTLQVCRQKKSSTEADETFKQGLVKF